MVKQLARGPASVHVLTEPFALSQQMVSKHIAVLVRARLVVKKKQGRESVCTLRPQALKTVSDWAMSYRQFWEESFDKLDGVLEQLKKEEKHGERNAAIDDNKNLRRTTRFGLEGVDRPEVRHPVVGAKGL